MSAEAKYYEALVAIRAMANKQTSNAEGVLAKIAQIAGFALKGDAPENNGAAYGQPLQLPRLQAPAVCLPGLLIERNASDGSFAARLGGNVIDAQKITITLEQGNSAVVAVKLTLPEEVDESGLAPAPDHDPGAA